VKGPSFHASACKAAKAVLTYVKGRTFHMPSRNTIKEFAPDSYYHVYNRGVEKRLIFLDDQDYTVFLGLLKKYLTGEKEKGVHRHIFKNFQGEISLLAYCLMPSHFHLLLHQSNPDSITKFLRRVLTGYVMYFNNRYHRIGGLFQGRYKASLIDKDEYLHHISRYIHLNPDNYFSWPYSSLQYYQGNKKSNWLQTDEILGLFNDDRAAYLDFVADYEDSKKELDMLKWQLANNVEE